MKRNNNYYLVGIVSWGYDCGVTVLKFDIKIKNFNKLRHFKGAGVYTKVSNFVNWINKVIAG